MSSNTILSDWMTRSSRLAGKTVQTNLCLRFWACTNYLLAVHTHSLTGVNWLVHACSQARRRCSRSFSLLWCVNFNINFCDNFTLNPMSAQARSRHLIYIKLWKQNYFNNCFLSINVYKSFLRHLSSYGTYDLLNVK